MFNTIFMIFVYHIFIWYDILFFDIYDILTDRPAICIPILDSQLLFQTRKQIMLLSYLSSACVRLLMNIS